ncbi:MAG: hypothetical protein LWX51_09085, partial [Deltaproteobacteria bacterium]|nr:hypothetical protein [Deltaproteobacteria bacterium]
MFDEKFVKKYSYGNLALYSKITKNWNNHLNSEWLCRVYLSAKMVLSASLMINSLEFAESKNLRILSSYLEYYSIQSSLRSVVFLLPEAKWDNGVLITTEHTKSINVVCDALAKLDKKFSEKLKNYILHLKAYRELISYRAPSSGDSFSKIHFDLELIELCQLLCEFAQVQSELLEVSILKHAKENYDFLDSYIDQVCNTEIHGFSFQDDEDWYRLDYLKRKYPLPTNIMHILSEGHVEDFFGSWLPKNDEDIEDEDVF